MRHFSRTFLAGIGLMFVVFFGLALAEAQESSEAQAVFQGEVRVEVVDLLVSVVDSIG